MSARINASNSAASAHKSASSSAATSCNNAASVSSTSAEDLPVQDIPDDMVPVEVNLPCYDILLLHSEDDLNKAVEVKKHLERDRNFNLSEGDKIHVLLYEDLARTFNRQISCLGEGMEHCTFVFILLTKSFCDSELSRFLEEECLMKSIRDPAKKWSIVPYFTESMDQSEYNKLFGLQCLRGHNYHTKDEFYYSSLKETVLKRRNIKAENEKRRAARIKKWKEDKYHELWIEEASKRIKNL